MTLLPCPFCGATPFKQQTKRYEVFVQDNDPEYGCGHYEYRQDWVAQCPHGCATRPVEKWNNRMMADDNLFEACRGLTVDIRNNLTLEKSIARLYAFVCSQALNTRTPEGEE